MGNVMRGRCCFQRSVRDIWPFLFCLYYTKLTLETSAPAVYITNLTQSQCMESPTCNRYNLLWFQLTYQSGSGRKYTASKTQAPKLSFTICKKMPFFGPYNIMQFTRTNFHNLKPIKRSNNFINSHHSLLTMRYKILTFRMKRRHNILTIYNNTHPYHQLPQTWISS